ncbi:hypothetical protein BDN70DRAFT_934783 [Pholiota conissans]|uniref:Uncharacterized protein n=1 Tax=Pholiota conissans TaxID=109636 RepID=A0A9P5YW13_9AGAR|nr:hypothetical protein BDN70DRAFT_934783 [Pholiota conissans]
MASKYQPKPANRRPLIAKVQTRKYEVEMPESEFFLIGQVVMVRRVSQQGAGVWMPAMVEMPVIKNEFTKDKEEERVYSVKVMAKAFEGGYTLEEYSPKRGEIRDVLAQERNYALNAFKGTDKEVVWAGWGS